MASWAASTRKSGGAKDGKPCPRFTAPCFVACWLNEANTLGPETRSILGAVWIVERDRARVDISSVPRAALVRDLDSMWGLGGGGGRGGPGGAGKGGAAPPPNEPSP
jgi:hypothetical protein